MSYSLRDLPLPVKVVASVFLMAVGVGYTSAMVQLHMQDAKSGKPMPTAEDVIRKYTGKKRFDPSAPQQKPVSRLEALVTSPTVAISGQSMSAAFTTQDRAKGELKYANAIKGKPLEVVEIIQAQRQGEQTVFKLWINLPDAERRRAYADDKFEVPPTQMPTQMTNAFRAGTTVKIRSIIDARCVTCHSKGGDKEDVPLDAYDDLAKFMAVEAPAPAGDWVKVEEPISITKLTQSTHAHLLSFAMLFSLTGLIFALTDYPKTMRVIGGPLVVLAVFADVSLWWLARLCDQWGPYFAVSIIFTGMVAGAGLFGQIVLSLFNMYGPRGKVVIGALMVIGGVIAGAMWVNVFEPGLKSKELALKQNDKKDDQPKAATHNDHAGKPEVKPKEDAKANGPKIEDKKSQEPPKVSPKASPSWAENLLAFPVKGPDGKVLSMDETPFVGGEDGNMARAFYDKDKAFKEFMESDKPQPEKDKLMAEREGERLALIAWIRSAEPARKAAYDADALALPAELAGKPLTSKYLKDGKVLVTTLIADRCLKCHGEGKKQYDEYPLDGYDKWKKYLEVPTAAAPAPAPAVGAAPTPVPTQPEPPPAAPKPPVVPIPASKDD